MLRVSGNASELVRRLVPFDVMVHVGRSKNVFNDVVQGVGAHEAFGRSRVDEDAVHLVALHEVESVEGVTVLRVVDEVCIIVLLGVDVGVIVKSLLVMSFRLRF